MTSSLKPLGQCCSNFMWSLLRLGEWKIAKMVAVHWPRWPSCPYIYMVKIFFSRTKDAMGLNLCTNHRWLEVYQVAKIIVVHRHLTFLQWGQVCFPMHLYGRYTFVWEKCWEFQMTSPLKPLGQCCSNFMWSLLGERKIAKIFTSIDQDGRHAHIWKKPLKIFFSRTEDAFGWIFAQIIRDRRSTKAAKMMVVYWRLTFLQWSHVCFHMYLYGSHTFVWTKCL